MTAPTGVFETFCGVEQWEPGESYDVVITSISSAASSLARSHAGRGPALMRRVSRAIRQPSPGTGWHDLADDRSLCARLRIADAGDYVPSGSGSRRVDVRLTARLAVLRTTCRLLVVLVGDDSWTYEVMAGQRGRLMHLDAHEDRNPHRRDGIDHSNVISRLLDDAPGLTVGQWGRRGVSPLPPDSAPPRYRRLCSPSEASEFLSASAGYTHIALDIDVIDPREISNVTCPLPGGPSLERIELICTSATGLRTLSLAEFAPAPASRIAAVEAYALVVFLLRVISAVVDAA
jgi:arginase family enzyme